MTWLLVETFNYQQLDFLIIISILKLQPTMHHSPLDFLNLIQTGSLWPGFKPGLLGDPGICNSSGYTGWWWLTSGSGGAVGTHLSSAWSGGGTIGGAAIGGGVGCPSPAFWWFCNT